MPHHAPSLVSLLPLTALVLGSFWLRARRLTRRLKLHLGRMWIIPALVIAYAGFTLWQFPPRGLDWLWLAVAGVLGGGLGWMRGKLMAISVDPESRDLMVQGSPLAIYLIAALVALRFGLRALLASEGSAPVMALSTANDVLICFTVGVLTVQRIEMALRAMKLKAGPA